MKRSVKGNVKGLRHEMPVERRTRHMKGWEGKSGTTTVSILGSPGSEQEPSRVNHTPEEDFLPLLRSNHNRPKDVVYLRGPEGQRDTSRTTLKDVVRSDTGSREGPEPRNNGPNVQRQRGQRPNTTSVYNIHENEREEQLDIPKILHSPSNLHP